MKVFGKVILVLVAIVAIIAILCVSSYNGVISSQEAVEQFKGDIDSNLQRRADLVPNLVETVKAYAKHEEEVFAAVSDARAAMMGAGSVGEQAEADAAMNSALSRLWRFPKAIRSLRQTRISGICKLSSRVLKTA